jgi:peptide/nickel transport system substrate-binding protein
MMRGVCYRLGRHVLWTVAVIALALGSPSIAIAQGEPPYYSDTQGPPQPGGMVNYLLYEDADRLNPVLGNTSIAAQVVTTILEGLTENDPDGNYVPVLAAELPTLENGGVSQDLTTVTWKLKPDVVWSNGEPFTSEDVKFTWQAAVSPANGAILAGRYAQIADIQTPDPHTVVITYKEFNAGYLDQFPWILPRFAGPVDDMQNWEFNRNPIGTGPFMLKEWVSGDHITVVKNPLYREAAAGKPYIDGINFLVVPSEEARTAMMIEQDAHIMLWAGSDAEAQIEASGVATGRTAPGIWVLELRFNLSKPFDGDPGPTPPHPILGDRRVREAITMAINRQRINRELLADTTVYDIDSPLAVGWMACQVEPWTYDPERAKALLDEVGWRDEDGDGVREAHGVPDVAEGTKLSLMMNGYTGFSTLELVELAVQEDLKNVGIEVKIENQDFAVIFGTWADKSPRMLGDYDLLIYDAGLFAEPGADIEQDFASSMIPSETNQGGTNIYRWNRQDVDAWIKAANSTPDINVRRENFCKVANALREDIVTFPILQFAEGSVYSHKLHGFTVSTWEWSTWDAENWWLEQE